MSPNLAKVIGYYIDNGDVFIIVNKIQDVPEVSGEGLRTSNWVESHPKGWAVLCPHIDEDILTVLELMHK